MKVVSADLSAATFIFGLILFGDEAKSLVNSGTRRISWAD